MANYRPKSLEELNSVYDKTLSSQNVIKDTASAISTEAFSEEPSASAQSIDEFFAQQNDLASGGCTDLSEDIGRFIAEFGKPATAEDEIAIRRKPVVPIKVKSSPLQNTQQSLQPENTDEAVISESVPEAAPEEPSAPAEQAKPEKTEFIITAEKNELFEEYMRIMSDEDDDADYSKSRASRKKKKGKKNTSAAHTDNTVSKESTPVSVPEIPDFEEDTEGSEFISFAADAEAEQSLINKEEDISSEEENLSPADTELTEEEEEEEFEQEKKPRKKTGLQLLLILVLFITLLSALAVTFLQTMVKVDSGEAFADKYYVYTADFTDRITDINEGDLLIVESVPASDNEVFAYGTPEGVSFAVQTYSGEPERTSGKNGKSDSITVLNTSIKGKLTRIYPSLGKVAAVISENFMTVMVALLVLAVFIILLLIFAFRHSSGKKGSSTKDNFSFDEEEDFDEASDEDFSLT